MIGLGFHLLSCFWLDVYVDYLRKLEVLKNASLWLSCPSAIGHGGLPLKDRWRHWFLYYNWLYLRMDQGFAVEVVLKWCGHFKKLDLPWNFGGMSLCVKVYLSCSMWFLALNLTPALPKCYDKCTLKVLKWTVKCFTFCKSHFQFSRSKTVVFPSVLNFELVTRW